MALIDDALGGGNIVAGLAIGAVGLVAWPLMRPLVRPVAKTVIKGGVLAYREAARLYDGAARGIGDLAKEAIAELGPEVAEEAVEKAGVAAAEEAL
jgi:hypothetical protein